MIDQQIQIFVSQDGKAQLEVALDRDTVWLSQGQMATLFDTSTDNISLHLRNIYQEGELNESATTEESSVVRQEGKRNVRRQIKHYNLDAIVSVGYRVSSKRATQFRQWATRVLKDHLVQGYSLNQHRLLERGIEFEQAVSLLSRTLTNQGLMSAEGEAIELFGLIRGNGLASALATIEQGFGDELFYPNVASRAAHLLYFLVKNHALALLVAESLPNQKALMIRLIEHFILLREPRT